MTRNVYNLQKLQKRTQIIFLITNYYFIILMINFTCKNWYIKTLYLWNA